MSTPKEILKKYWNYNQFRYPQEEIITAVLEKKDALILLATGGGKSLCYQVPTLLSEGICIVISPLIALMEDQVSSLMKRNIKAIQLTSQLKKDALITAFDNLKFGGFKFLFLSPEKLQSSFIQDKIKELNVSLIAVDEAHCISEWGHDFRPSYLQLKILKELHPNAPLLALTATATKRVLSDIILNLNIEDALIFKSSFERSNLFYGVIYTENIYRKLLELTLKVKESIIIYTNSRKQTKEVCSFLLRNNLKSSYYHGGLSNSEKNSAYKNWMSNKTPIMVSTNAFGMGIDKSNVRAVIHINTPSSIENYIQEAGRAGRDGENSYSVIITNESEIHETKTKLINNIATRDEVKKVYDCLNQYYKVAFGELPQNSFNFSIQKFCKTYQLKVLKTYNAIKTLERENIIAMDDNYSKRSTLKFTISNDQLFKYIENHPSKSAVLKLILRSYGGVFDHYTIIDEYLISVKLGKSKKVVTQILNDLHADRIIVYNFENTESKLSFLVAREDDFIMHTISKNIKNQNKLKLDKLYATIAYLKNSKNCRNIQLLSYFGENKSKPCGQCDNCRSKHRNNDPTTNTGNQILALLADHDLSSLELQKNMSCTEGTLINSLKILLEQNKIAITSQNKFKLNF